MGWPVTPLCSFFSKPLVRVPESGDQALLEAVLQEQRRPRHGAEAERTSEPGAMFLRWGNVPTFHPKPRW